MYFKDRSHAGRLLSENLSSLNIDKNKTIVIALARGGVPVALEVAKKLELPLDIVLVKTIGMPSNSRLAIGAVSEEGEVFYNLELMKYFDYDIKDIEPLKLHAIEGLHQLSFLRKYKKTNLSLENKEVILVDDGIETGATMGVVIQLMRKRKVGKIIVAAPIVSPEVLQKLVLKTDKVISVIAPQFINSIAQWYEDFDPVENEEVIKILNKYSSDQCLSMPQ